VSARGNERLRLVVLDLGLVRHARLGSLVLGVLDRCLRVRGGERRGRQQHERQRSQGEGHGSDPVTRVTWAVRAVRAVVQHGRLLVRSPARNC
jgi:hypothetical protein